MAPLGALLPGMPLTVLSELVAESEQSLPLIRLVDRVTHVYRYRLVLAHTRDRDMCVHTHTNNGKHIHVCLKSEQTWRRKISCFLGLALIGIHGWI